MYHYSIFSRFTMLTVLIVLLSTLTLKSYGQPINDADSVQLSFNINGFSISAVLQKNVQLLEKISTPFEENEQLHYKGQLSGYPNSSIRVSYNHDHWQGVLLFDGALYIVDSSHKAMTSVAGGLRTYLAEKDKKTQICASGSIKNTLPKNDDSIAFSQADTANADNNQSSHNFIVSYLTSASASLADVCANRINGVCLLPKIELAYDLSYQELPGNAEQRALRELNEMEIFFRDGLGYQFSQISITMLSEEQDELIGSSDDPNDLLDRLRKLRSSNRLDFLKQRESIFHLVTGRDFSEAESNVKGIAYLGTVCAADGSNTGLSKADDSSLVSLVMAHEIGHNLGAEHDSLETNGCPDNQNVMSANLNLQSSRFDGFSSCSIEAINQNVANNLSGACFKFPVDIGITASLDNPVSPDLETPFDLVYDINTDDGFIPIGSLNVRGEISNTDEGQFVSASIEGSVCTSMASSYNCTVNNPLRDFSLKVTATVNQNAAELNMQHWVSTAIEYTEDVISSNDELNVTLNNFYEPSPTVDSIDEEPRSNNSGGGGGSIHPLGLVLLGGFYVFRRFKK